jgi:tRNA modification GTPase
MHIDDTICALSSPSGTGAIAILRVSGEKAIAICNKLITFPDNKKHLTTLKAILFMWGKLYIKEIKSMK